MRRRWAILFVFAAGLLPARVFWRQPAVQPREWNSAYQAPIRLQEGRGEIQVWSTADTLAGIKATLENTYGDDLRWMPGEVMAWGLVRRNGILLRYLIQPLPEGGHWITQVRQSERNAGRPGQRPRSHRLSEIPVLPSSVPTFYSMDEGNGQQVEISETSRSPQSVLDEMASRLADAGWHPSPVNTGGFQLFVRGESVAMLMAARQSDGITRLLRLHKPAGVTY